MSGVAERVGHPHQEDAMTLTAALSSELADTPCSVADCLEVAQTMGSAGVRIDPGIDAPPDFATLTLGLPLCINHAHLLRLGCTLAHFSSGL
jgi:hypothetical protein